MTWLNTVLSTWFHYRYTGGWGDALVILSAVFMAGLAIGLFYHGLSRVIDFVPEVTSK